MLMALYSLLLTLVLVLGSPWWLYQMATKGRYRDGLSGRLGIVPQSIRSAARGHRVVWVHAVSVGEILAAERLMAELSTALPGWVVVLSTTTATGYGIAQRRMSSQPVFYLPFDFAFSIRAYLRVLQPRLLILMENELWPRLLVECRRRSIPVAVANARVSDRSFDKPAWHHRLRSPMLHKIDLFLAQGHETAERLQVMGADSDRIIVTGNLKHDASASAMTPLTDLLRPALAGRPVLVAGSTLEGEERALLKAWPAILGAHPTAALILAPRHPQRFAAVAALLRELGLPFAAASTMALDCPLHLPGSIVLLDTLGDLASLYSLARVAFVGGSLVPHGGHNPLEPARFGVPVVMGPAYQNFREMVDGMRAANAVVIVEPATLGARILDLFDDAQGFGEGGRSYYESQTGATARTVSALLGLLEAPR